MQIWDPELLKAVLQHRDTVKRAVAMLRDNWMSVIGASSRPSRIDASVISLAKRLNRTGLFRGSLQFDSYPAVKKYIVQHDVYLTTSAKRVLLRPFKE